MTDNDVLLKQKQREFNKAMYRYENNIFFKNINLVISILILLLQIYLGYKLINIKHKFYSFCIIFILAYISADLIGGIVHLLSDNNTDYLNFFIGPLIAAFQLHHKTPKYKNNNIFKVYFNENGSKIWLLIFMIVFISLEHHIKNKYIITYFILLFFLSSLAEVSHYLCHNSKNKFVKILQHYKILLDPNIHIYHHTKDNMNYTFLNGCTDFIVNHIAQKYFIGYKTTSDLYSKTYIGQRYGRT